MVITKKMRVELIAKTIEAAENVGLPFAKCHACSFDFVHGAEDPNIECNFVGAPSESESDLRLYCRDCNTLKNRGRPFPATDRATIGRRTLCACGKAFWVSDFDYAVSIDLVKTCALPCPECLPVDPNDRPKRKRKKKLGRGLPEGFSPAKEVFRKAGLIK
jgi:hypothetical protein